MRFRCTITKHGDALDVDFSGSSPQVPGSINVPFSMTQPCTCAGVRCIMDMGLPTNTGFMRALKVTAEPGTVVHPTTLAPVAARGLTALHRAVSGMLRTYRLTEDAYGVVFDAGEQGLQVAQAATHAARQRIRQAREQSAGQLS